MVLQMDMVVSVEEKEEWERIQQWLLGCCQYSINISRLVR